jgi:hypothetical protein
MGARKQLRPDRILGSPRGRVSRAAQHPGGSPDMVAGRAGPGSRGLTDECDVGPCLAWAPLDTGGYNEEPIVSSDIVQSPISAILDGPLTTVIDGTQVKGHRLV